MDMFGRFEDLDGIIGELDTSVHPYISMHLDGIDRTSSTYVKPLMMLYSCLIMPPFSLAVSLALRRYVSIEGISDNGHATHLSSASTGAPALRVI
jgi:hypothetical protein